MNEEPSQLVLTHINFWQQFAVRSSLADENGKPTYSISELNKWGRENYPKEMGEIPEAFLK